MKRKPFRATFVHINRRCEHLIIPAAQLIQQSILSEQKEQERVGQRRRRCFRVPVGHVCTELAAHDARPPDKRQPAAPEHQKQPVFVGVRNIPRSLFPNECRVC